MKRKDMKGTATVEFAIVFLIMLMVFFAIVVFSIALYDKIIITNAASEAARVGIRLNSGDKTADEINKIVKDKAIGACSGQLMTFKNANIPSVVVTGAKSGFGNPLTVTISYQYAGHLLSGWWTPTLTATITMYNQ